jgi:hypothetical protein
MSEAEKLMADVPARDPLFVLAVMARIEQRRFRHELARTGAFALAAMALLALVVPQLVSLMPGFDIGRLGDLSATSNIVIATALMAAPILLPRLLRAI